MTDKFPSFADWAFGHYLSQEDIDRMGPEWDFREKTWRSRGIISREQLAHDAIGANSVLYTRYLQAKRRYEAWQELKAAFRALWQSLRGKRDQ